jgi:tRNA G26 N,N-dimethylase Trm1
MYISTWLLSGDLALSEIVEKLDAAGFEVSTTHYILRGAKNDCVVIATKYFIDKANVLGLGNNVMVHILFAE